MQHLLRGGRITPFDSDSDFLKTQNLDSSLIRRSAVLKPSPRPNRGLFSKESGGYGYKARLPARGNIQKRRHDMHGAMRFMILKREFLFATFLHG
jgi:hypothetical protein